MNVVSPHMYISLYRLPGSRVNTTFQRPELFKIGVIPCGRGIGARWKLTFSSWFLLLGYIRRGRRGKIDGVEVFWILLYGTGREIALLSFVDE